MWKRIVFLFIFIFLAGFATAAVAQDRLLGTAPIEKSRPVYPENKKVATLKAQYKSRHDKLMQKLETATPAERPGLQQKVEKLKADERDDVLKLMFQNAIDKGDTERAVGASDALNDHLTPKKVEPEDSERPIVRGFAPYLKKPDDRELE